MTNLIQQVREYADEQADKKKHVAYQTLRRDLGELLIAHFNKNTPIESLREICDKMESDYQSLIAEIASDLERLNKALDIGLTAIEDANHD